VVARVFDRVRSWSRAGLVAILSSFGHAELLGLVLELVARQDELSAANLKLTAENERLRALSGKSSGNSESAWVLRVIRPGFCGCS